MPVEGGVLYLFVMTPRVISKLDLRMESLRDRSLTLMSMITLNVLLYPARVDSLNCRIRFVVIMYVMYELQC